LGKTWANLGKNLVHPQKYALPYTYDTTSLRSSIALMAISGKKLNMPYVAVSRVVIVLGGGCLGGGCPKWQLS